ncbi:MAG: hypothetical protein IPL59_02805 [Candidatus Competibacteraceae bacterium]|nr:hypothetical protein [Candidatus Competibacteraceae bacterium]
MVTDQWSVFAGYKSGKTEWSQSYEYSPPPGSHNSIIRQTNYDFKQDGPFLGTSYSFFIDPGILTFKTGYAYLDGKYTYNFLETPIGITIIDNMDGNSNAFSFGVSWTQSITENLGISIGANYHLYEFNLAGSSSIGNAYLDNEPYRSSTRTDGNFTEKLFTVTASAIYRF